MKQLLLSLACAAVLLSACETSGAKEGAKQGAFYGALGSAVSSIVWGRGDPLGDAARGAVVGGTVGAVSGSVNESKQKKAQEQQGKQADLAEQNQVLSQRNRQLELEARLLKEIGPDNTEAVRLLVHCKHERAVKACRRAASSESEPFRVAGIWLEAVSAQDRRDLSGARALYPRLVELDDRVSSADEAEIAVLKLVTNLEDTREEFGFARRCE